MFALLGPNGAGKTTIVEILEGFRTRTKGTVAVLGADPETGGRALRERVGIVLQKCGIDPFFSVSELVIATGKSYPAPRPVAEVLELVGLSDKAGARVKTLSGGQQRRLDLALALVGDPELVFLDEPTTGFDPSARRASWDLIEGLCRLGKTVLLTTHYMEEAQRLADRIVVIAQGRIVAEGTPETIGGRDHARPSSASLPPGVSITDAPARDVRSTTGFVSISTPEPTRVLYDLTQWALANGGELAGLEVQRPSLEDVPGPHAIDYRPHGERRGTARRPARARAEALLAQSGERVLHVRVPDHVPRDLRVAQLERPDRGSRQHPVRAVLRAVDRRVRHLLRVLREPCGHAAVPSRDGSVETSALDTASPTRVPERRHRARCSSERCSRSSSPPPAWRSTACTSTARAWFRCSSRSRWRRRRVARSVSPSRPFVPNADAAPAIVNFVYFPIAFISGTFFPVNQSSVLAHIASVFPVRHVILAVFAGFDPLRSGPSFGGVTSRWSRSWGVAGLVDRGPPLPLGAPAIARTTAPSAQGRQVRGGARRELEDPRCNRPSRPAGAARRR